MIATRRGFLRFTGASAGGASLLFALGCRPEQILDVGNERRDRSPFGTPAAAEIDLVSHLLARCSFGARPQDRDELLTLASTPADAVEAWLEQQLEPDRIDDGPADAAMRRFSSTCEPLAELYEYKQQVLRRDLVSATVLHAVLTRRQLQEVMVHFWTDHFNIDLGKGDCAWLKAADDRDVIRRHCLGRFEDLLRASALSPAMLWYLDGRLNQRTNPGERPNENYARELLELHTLGVHGGYTQNDVMEVARCLTGFTVREKSGFGKGKVEFVAHRHDDGEKVVLGTRIPAGLGRGDLDRVLDLVARHPSTARFLAFKLCRRFIADDPPNAAVNAVAEAFARSQGDVKATLRALFARPELRGDGAHATLRGKKLKRPFHFLVSTLRATDAVTDAGSALTDYLVSMGQVPFAYPTPDGYPEEASAWTGTLMWRWKLAGALVAGSIDGSRLQPEELAARAGGERALLCHLLGRLPADVESRAWEDAGSVRAGIALTLASPSFQRF